MKCLFPAALVANPKATVVLATLEGDVHDWQERLRTVLMATAIASWIAQGLPTPAPGGHGRERARWLWGSAG